MSLAALERPAILLALLAWLVVGVPAQSEPEAEATAPTPSAAPEPEPVPLEDISDQAAITRIELQRLRPKEASTRELERISAELDPALAEIETFLARADETLAGRPSPRTLSILEAQLQDAKDRLGAWEASIDDVLRTSREALDRLDAVGATWDQTADFAERWGVSETTTKRIQATRREVAETRSAVLSRAREWIVLRDRMVNPESDLSGGIEQLQAASAGRIQGILRADVPPLWSPELRESALEEWETRTPLRAEIAKVGPYARENALELAMHLVLFVVLGLGLRSLRGRARIRAETEYDLREAEEVFERPWAMALIISAVVAAPLYELAPRAVIVGASPLIALAAVAIGQRFMVPSMAPLIWGLMAIFVADRLGAFLDGEPTLAHLASVAEIVVALGILLWIRQPRRLADIPPEQRRSPFLRMLSVALGIGTALVALALVAAVIGWGALSAFLWGGVLRSAYLGFFVFVVLKVSRSLASFALVTWPLRLIRGVSSHRILVRRRVERLLYVVALGAWVSLTLNELGLWGPVQSGVADALSARLSVGSLSVSGGDLIAFVLTVWLSFLLARLVDFVLREDVFSRLKTGRGVPYAISGLVRYTLIFLGFLVGLAAAGVEFSNLTVIAGGLGVGVGFGLQNVVNNFVSGLILLLERPVQVGDNIQLPDVFGRIKRIGIRASVVETFDGAEIIVPNGLLISETVTNWTLSNNRRRIEVDVGVAYGTPAPRVIELLLEVGNAHPKVMDTPEPQALFMGFGDSALLFRLRAWIGRFDEGFPIRSELTVAIQVALEEAGIQVPFPQRDLHLVSGSWSADSEK